MFIAASERHDGLGPFTGDREHQAPNGASVFFRPVAFYKHCTATRLKERRASLLVSIVILARTKESR